MAKEPAKSQEAPAKQGPSKLIIIIIGVLALLVLALGGGLAYFFLIKGADSGETVQATAPQPANPDLDEKGNLLPPIYIEMKPPLLANLTKGRYKMLQVSLQLLTRQQGMQDFLKDNDPMIRHHLINILNVQDGEQLLSREGKEELLSQMQTKLAELAVQAGVQGRLSGIYFTKFTME